VGEYDGDVGEYDGDVGEYATNNVFKSVDMNSHGLVGLYDGLVGE
jgi:hypothetical protein